MKTKEELNALKNELEALSRKLAELNEDEMKQVTGGIAPGRIYWKNSAGKKNSNTPSNDELNGAN